MATILSLPVELIDCVSKYLDGDDLLALRMTCQGCNNGARDAHMESLYSFRLVPFTLISLRNLVKISKHPEARLRVRELCFSQTYLATNSPPGISGKIEFLGNDGDVYTEIRTKIQAASLSQVKQLGSRYIQGDVQAHLAQAFANLPNIRVITISTAEDDHVVLSRSEFNLLFPFARMVPGKRLPAALRMFYRWRPFQGSMGFSFIWTAVATCLVSSNLERIERIVMDAQPCTGVSPDWFLTHIPPQESGKNIFSRLKVLHIAVDQSELGYAPSVGLRNDTGFYGWIRAVGAQLVELSIFGDGVGRKSLIKDTRGNSAFEFGIPGDLCLPKLERLALKGLSLTVDEFSEFLLNGSPRLSSLHITLCGIKNPAVGWYDILKILRNKKLSSFLFSSSRYWKIMHGLGYTENYILPDLAVEGHWDIAECKVNLVKDKNLSRELDTHNVAERFWESISEGHWVDG